MQETQPMWDPISIDYRMPWALRLFVLYLGIVIAISLVKSLNIVRQLWSFTITKRISLRKFRTAEEEIESLAQSALTNKFNHLAVIKAWTENTSPPQGQQAANRLLLLWHKCFIKVVALKKIAILTLLLAGLTVVCLTTDFLEQVAVNKFSSAGVLSAGIRESMTPLLLGLPVCIALYLSYSIYDAALKRRMTSWNYFRSRAGTNISNNEIEERTQRLTKPC